MLNPQHPRGFRFPANLSNCFHNRYRVLGLSTDCQLAVFHARRAVDIGPPDQRALLLRNLANHMIVAAEYSGDAEMLSEAISLTREALDNVPDSWRSFALMTLGTALFIKASHFGDNDALTESIHYLRQSLGRVHEGTLLHVESTLYASKALLQQCEMVPSRRSCCLTEAIQLLEGLLRGKIPMVYQGEVLQVAAKAYRARYYHHGHHEDLTSALAADHKTLDLRPPGHRLRYLSLAAVSQDLALCHELSEATNTENASLERALQMQNEALKELAEGHPDRARMSISLAQLLLIPRTPYTDCEKAFSLIVQMLRHLQGNVYRSVVDLVPLLTSVEVNFASKWVAVDPTRKQCLDVYQALIGVLPRLASLDMNLARRIQVLSQVRHLATRAFEHSIQLLQFDRAIELLEAGRAVFWSQHLRLRSSFDALDSKTAQELRGIARRLEFAADSNISLDIEDNLARARMESIMTERRRLSDRFDELVREVRLQPGMNRFLRHLDYTALSSAAMRGPIVILQPSWMCVITAPYTEPEIVQLQEVTDEWLERAARTFRHSSHTSSSDRGARKSSVGDMQSYISAEYSILRELWRRIAQPLLSVLGWTVSYLLAFPIG
jgi:hypothetical protein